MALSPEAAWLYARPGADLTGTNRTPLPHLPGLRDINHFHVPLQDMPALLRPGGPGLPGMPTPAMNQAFVDSLRAALPTYEANVGGAYGTGAPMPPNLGISVFNVDQTKFPYAPPVVSAWAPSQRQVHSEPLSAASALQMHAPTAATLFNQSQRAAFQDQVRNSLMPGAPQAIYTVLPPCGPTASDCSELLGGGNGAHGAYQGLLPRNASTVLSSLSLDDPTRAAFRAQFGGPYMIPRETIFPSLLRGLHDIRGLKCGGHVTRNPLALFAPGSLSAFAPRPSLAPFIPGLSAFAPRPPRAVSKRSERKRLVQSSRR